MILDKHLTDFTGTQCNKIGATYKALINALLQIKCVEDAEGVCELLKKSPPQPVSCQASGSASDSPPPASKPAPKHSTPSPAVSTTGK